MLQDRWSIESRRAEELQSDTSEKLDESVEAAVLLRQELEEAQSTAATEIQRFKGHTTQAHNKHTTHTREQGQ